MNAVNEDITAVAERLQVPSAAVELTRRYEVIDLHLDTFIPMRLFGYDLHRRHGVGWHGGRAFGHLDLPRAQDAGLTGAMWSITTNPWRTQAGRWTVFLKNLERLKGVIDDAPGMAVVRAVDEYRVARAKGDHACMISVQGGNCFDGAPDSVVSVPDHLITRVTLVHLTNSKVGASNSPFHYSRSNKGLTEHGRRLVEACNRGRVFVDLAHIHREGFWDAVEAHDMTQPLIATHTGVTGVTPHWRNLDDDQLRVIAKTGGVIGIIYAVHFLRGKHGYTDHRMILEHMEHVIEVAGEDHVAIGSDYDGSIVPPSDLRSGDSYPRLVAGMLDRGWSEDRIRKILGENFLASFARLRPSID